MMMTTRRAPTVLCVDDNAEVAEALRRTLSRQAELTWLGWLPDATGLVERVREACPSIVLLDLDMPGRNPFEAMAEVLAVCAGTRIVVFSGHARKDLIDRAIDAGAWGYVSKNEGEGVLLDAIARVLDGEFFLSPEVRSVLDA